VEPSDRAIVIAVDAAAGTRGRKVTLTTKRVDVRDPRRHERRHERAPGLGQGSAETERRLRVARGRTRGRLGRPVYCESRFLLSSFGSRRDELPRAPSRMEERWLELVTTGDGVQEPHNISSSHRV